MNAAHSPAIGLAEAYCESLREKLASGLWDRKRLTAASFEIRRALVSGFLGSNLLPRPVRRREKAVRLLEAVQRFLQSVPGVRSTGSIYTLIAVEPFCPEELRP